MYRKERVLHVNSNRKCGRTKERYWLDVPFPHVHMITRMLRPERIRKPQLQTIAASHSRRPGAILYGTQLN